MLGKAMRLGGAIALVLGCAVLAGAAFADNGNGNGNGPPGGIPPGQEKKTEPTPPPPPAPAPQPASPANPAPSPASAPGNSGGAPGQAKKTETRQPAGKGPGKSASAPRLKTKDGGSPQPAVETRRRPASPGKSAEAQHHVIICHRTGSEKNPYVVINISVRGWIHGHQTHPALNGRSDILLKDPARPGEKMPESACPAARPAAAVQPPPPPAPLAAAVQPPPAVAVQPQPSPVAVQPQPSPGVVVAGTIQPSPQPAVPAAERAAAPAGAAAPAAVAPSGRARPARGPAGGVLGEVARTGTRATLPFTGVPVWIAALAGAALLAAGLGLRLGRSA